MGVRELRQNASALLAQVEAGVDIEVTNHGRPVARLTSVHRSHRLRDDLIEEGLLIPGRGDPLEVEPVASSPGDPPTAEVLSRLRAER